jgi:hypothetical protein
MDLYLLSMPGFLILSGLRGNRMQEIRKEERKKLEGFLAGDSAKLAIVYGRPGMGMKDFLDPLRKDSDCLFFRAYPTSQDMELALFASSIGMGSESPLDLREILDWISGQAQKQAAGQNLLLVIESFSNFLAASPDNDALVCHYLIDVWKDLPIKVLIEDESLLSLQKTILSRQSFWAKIDRIEISLSPLSFCEASSFFRGLSWPDALLLYGICGGIPEVLKEWMYDMPSDLRPMGEADSKSDLAMTDPSDQKKNRTSLRTSDWISLVEKFFDPFIQKAAHPQVILREELREPAFYNRLLTAMASGRKRVGQLSLETGKSKDIVAPYLNTLIRLGLVEKERPLTEKGNQRKSRYSLVNTMDLFYYRYLVPHYDLLVKGEYQKIWEEVFLLDRSAFEKTVFEKIAGQFLCDPKNGLPFLADEIGGWWEYASMRYGSKKMGDSEIKESFDLIGNGSWQGKKMQAFCRISFDEKPVDVREIKGLIALSRRLSKDGKKFYLVFSRTGFEENARTAASAIPEIILLTVSETMEKLLK